MCRRVVSIRLAPNSSSPATLTYKGRPVETMLARRESYIADVLTIIRAWKAAGAPRASVPPIGSFGEWSELCRQPLLWLGLPDPATSLLEQLRNDPDVASLAAFMEAWSYEFGERPVQLPRYDKCPYLLPNPRTKKPYTCIKHPWDTARDAAGLAGLHMHDLRHSAASFMINAGIDLFAVGKVLGHADHQSTMRYSHLANDTLMQAVEAGAAKMNVDWAGTVPDDDQDSE